ncbi:MAG: hypothetical protein IT161_23040 [Bryobacterales bacterium]|nr:hypothetical protein [Bryobacterales bacterium]
MKLAGVFLGAALAAPGVWAAQPQAAKTQASAPRAVELPAGAEKVRDGVWKAKDKDGKTWFYARTPFGYSRSAEDPEAASSPAQTEQLVLVTAIDGNTARFERPTPFGGARWTRKLSELTDEEKAAVDQYKAKQSSRKE